MGEFHVGRTETDVRLDGEARILAHRLLQLWSELLERGATIRQVPLDSPVDVLRFRIEWETRRLRVLAEGDQT